MNNNKVLVSFDPDTLISPNNSYRIWQFNEFREFVKSLANKYDQIDLYLLTNSTDSDYITSVQDQINAMNLDVVLLPTNKVVTYTTEALKIAGIEGLAIDIHFDGDFITTQDLELNAITQGICVDFHRVTNLRVSKWLDSFQFWYKELTGKSVEVI